MVHWAHLSLCPKWHVDRCAVFAQGVPLLYNAPLHFPQFLSLVTLTFVIDIQTHPNKGTNTLPGCEFGANPFSDSGDISYTNKKVTGSTKNRILQSSLCAVMSWNTGLKLKWTVTVQPENCIVEKSVHDMKLEMPARGLRSSPPARTASLVVGSSKAPWPWPWLWIGSRSHQHTQYM